MAQANNKREIFYQNLMDAGCSEELIKECILLQEEGNIGQIIKLLGEYKQNILKSLHKKEKSIDCLDFLIYRLKKENK